MVGPTISVNEIPLAGPDTWLGAAALGFAAEAADTAAALGLLIVIIRRRGKNGSQILWVADRPTENVYNLL